MSDAAASAPWWEGLDPGSSIPAGVVLIDCDFADVTELDESARLVRAQYAAGVEYVARVFGAAEPIAWEGDRATLIVGGVGLESLAAHAFKAARYLWQRAFVDLGVPARVAVHVGRVIRRSEPWAFEGPALGVGRALLNVAPPQAIALSPEAALSLPSSEHADLAPLPVPTDAEDIAYLFPRGAQPTGLSLPVNAAGELVLWDALRAYASGPDVRSLRYVGFRLQRKEPLCLDLDDVFVEPLATPRAAPAAALRTAPMGGRAYRARKPAAQEQSRPALLGALLKESRHLVLLGDPGAGKTTVIRWLAMIAGEGRLPALVGEIEPVLPLPISVGRLAELRRRDPRGALLDALARYYADRDVGKEEVLRTFLERCARRGRCLFLLDGLDEVREEERAETQRWLEDFIERARGNRLVATSRVVGYTGFHGCQGAIEATLQPFEQAQIERYVRAFHRAYFAWERGAPRTEEAEKMADGLLEALQQSPRLSALASNPFMLSALALIHRAEGRLPRHRVQAYELLSRALCETWDMARRLVAAERPRAAIAYEEEAIPILGELALAMHRKYPTGVAPTAFVESTLAAALTRRRSVDAAEAERAARDFLKRATNEAPILLERGPGQWGFSHLTFQEFFVAAGLHATDRFEKVAMKHALEPRWEEILRLGVSHMALIQNRTLAASRVVMQMLEWQAPPWCRWVDQVLQKQILVAAALAGELSATLPAKERSRIVHALSRYARGLRNDQAEPFGNLNEEPRLFQRSIRQLAGTDIAEPLAKTLLEGIRTLPLGETRILIEAIGGLRVRAAIDALVDLLAPVMRDHPELRHWIGLALHEAVDFGALVEIAGREEPLWRLIAITALAFDKSTGAPEVIIAALHDEAVEVREAAADSLLDLNFYAILEEEPPQATLVEALDDRSEAVRDAAIFFLDRPRFADSTVEEALLKVAQNDTSQRIRSWAANAALRLFASDRAVDVAMGILANNSNDDDRWNLVQGFGKSQEYHAAQFGRILENTHSSNDLLRAGCVLALWMFPSDAAEEAALRATRDASGVVRKEAVHALSEMNYGRILEVASAALEDSDASVREAGAWALSPRPHMPTEEPLLRGLADPSAAVRRVCLYGLRGRRSEAVMAALLSALRDEDAAVRENAVSALEGLKDDSVTQTLLAAASDESDQVRAVVARTMRTLPEQTALTHLLRLLKDASPRVRWSAARSLASIDAPAAIPALARHARREPAARTALWHMAERRGWKIPRPRPA